MRISWIGLINDLIIIGLLLWNWQFGLFYLLGTVSVLVVQTIKEMR